METAVLVWWSSLAAVAACNVFAWIWTARTAGRGVGLGPDARHAMRWQVVLSAGYVAGCAYRSVFPVFDVPRLCLFDSWLSSVVLGRSVATIAELCFATQWALLLGGVARATGSRAGLAVARSIPPLIAMAEVCSWTAVLTTSNAGHVLEESIWGVCAAMLVASLSIAWGRIVPSARPVFGVAVALGTVYVFYMFLVDVPMYWTRWMDDLRQRRETLDFAQGFVDVALRRVISHRWEDWKSEVVWMTVYFSVAVWTSIALIHAPRLHAVARAEATGHG